MTEEITKDYDHIVEFLRENIQDLAVVYVFGSSAKGQTTEKSDIDIAFYAESSFTVNKTQQRLKILDYKNFLSQRINKEVDLIDMSLASPIINFQIFQTGKIVYQPNGDKLKTAFATFKVNKLSEYYDFKIERKEAEESLKNKRII